MSERERDGQPLGVREVLVEGLADLVVRARVADLAHGDVGVALLHAGDGGEDGLDLVLRLVRVAADVELDEHGVAVARDLAAPVAA